MKQFRKQFNFKTLLFALGFLVSVAVLPLQAQEKKVNTAFNTKDMHNQDMEYADQLKEIIEKYPAFTFKYGLKNGKVQDVVVTGIDDEIDRKRMEVVLFNLNHHRNMVTKTDERVGVFYDIDKHAMYEGGEQALEQEILSNLEYPKDAKNWGVEGTIYVKVVVDDDGTIPFVTTSTNIETSVESYLDDLEEQAIAAVHETSGEWEPAEVEGVEVASLAVIPITFELENHPFMR
ncbi:energy transducer TonB [uncultured Draconibacterium sp.]|uniref:energy transducer TonB n=1 Tax=uncultured Draconibacterium sp. TaxID=1573823 RepID=UPI0025DC0616|nr:energy transducer TonB [uncultured Draconibacterium sp.]